MTSRKKISEKSPRKLAKDKQRQHLLNANIECIAKLGLSDTSITHISKAANMSRGIINFYFESKEKMMLETLDYVLRQQMALLKNDINVSDSHAFLNELAQKLLLTPTKRQQRTWLAFAAHAASHNSYAQKMREFSEQLKSILLGKDIDSQKCEQFLTILHGLRVDFMLTKASFTQDEKLEHIEYSLAVLSGGTQKSSNDNKAANTEQKPAKVEPIKSKQKPKKTDNSDAAIGDLFASLG